MAVTDVSDEGQPETEEDGAEYDGEQSPVFQQLVGPVVHYPCDQGLNVAELAVDSEHQQHYEEDGGPEDGAR